MFTRPPITRFEHLDAGIGAERQALGGSPDDDTETETGETGTANGPQLSACETEVGTPVCEDTTANSKANTGCKDRKKTGPQLPPSIWRYAFVYYVTHI